MILLKNHLLNVGIKRKGAELCSIKSTLNNKEFVWQADPDIWGSHAPVLFPIIGCMKNNTYFYNGLKYNMPKHGFVRHNNNVEVVEQTSDMVKFRLESSEELSKIYPFKFQFNLKYQLKENFLKVNHEVLNLDSKPMYFSLGGHPAFNCSFEKDENYNDYFLEFEALETSKSYLLNISNGLLTDKTISVFSDENRINLSDTLFDNDALIFKDLKSRKVYLKHKDKGNLLSVTFKDFEYLGIWAKPKAPYVCIEPWLGIADHENTNQKIEDKEGIILLENNKSFNASYTIEIAKSHLV
ncbi:aldose 1-epimerase family protein [Winogradskyella sp. A2]|uniref:aldose 1-epimerase family protein n=1 Tax=Winogradskyella sp. A2 TaxID=3366944 RepID=UPI00398C62C0